MIDPMAFLLAALALLATPGPTNTLLATSGAMRGFAGSLRLVPAEIAGYLTSITILSLGLAPLLEQRPELASVLKLVCAAYIAVLAWRLWRRGGSAADGLPIGPRQVFVTTCLNPKGVIFALVIVPGLAQGEILAASPYLAALAGLIGLVGGSWIALGAMLAGRTRRAAAAPLLVCRAGSIALAVFAASILKLAVS